METNYIFAISIIILFVIAQYVSNIAVAKKVREESKKSVNALINSLKDYNKKSEDAVHIPAVRENNTPEDINFTMYDSMADAFVDVPDSIPDTYPELAPVNETPVNDLEELFDPKKYANDLGITEKTTVTQMVKLYNYCKNHNIGEQYDDVIVNLLSHFAFSLRNKESFEFAITEANNLTNDPETTIRLKVKLIEHILLCTHWCDFNEG